MVELAALSSEEHPPRDLVRHAQAAEAAGFTFALISDHLHPWIERQGHSPFVWSVIGAIVQATSRLRLDTGVTCPLIRYDPAIVAQAAATCAALMPRRFCLGPGSGENLNEHIVGARWPSAPVRQCMLEEAVEIIRLLWEGGERSHFGTYYTLDHARPYTLVRGPDPERHRSAIQEFVDAGVDNVYVHQVGHDQAGFVEVYRREILPRF